MTAATTTRYCKACDYPLDTAPELRCPECGRAFTADDPRTYADKPHARRRRWTRRVAATALALVILWSLAPREIARLAFSFENADRRTVTTETRCYLIAPSWFPFRYPSFTLSKQVLPRTAGPLHTVMVSFWRFSAYRYKDASGWAAGFQPSPNFVTAISFGHLMINGPHQVELFAVLPEYTEDLAERIIYTHHNDPRRTITITSIHRDLIEPPPPPPPQTH